ncbi:MAG: amino acid permease [Bryobacterales bacterium]|nr:amino acid permease [Bryobacterales bacterium]
MSYLRRKNIDDLVAAAQATRLRQTLGPWSLVALGVGAVIGSGIFILTGTAAAGETLAFQSVLHAPVLDLLAHGPEALSTIGRPGAGPAIALSFLITAIVCGFAALCYAELASMIPVAGSAYTYAYATLGELIAWIIGWDLILEYAVSNMAVAVGFSAYLNDVLETVFGVHFPDHLAGPIFAGGEMTGNWFNFPAFLCIMAITWVLVRGIRESSAANNLMVFVKVAAILVFVIGAARAVEPANWTPFMPNGLPGVITGSAIVFFAFIGFDSVSTAAEECRRPQRDLPVGILGTLVVCSILYVSVAVVLTGIAPYHTLGNASPVVNALAALGMHDIRRLVGIGAVVGMVSSLLVYQYGQTRIWYAMSRDGLLPKAFSRIHGKHRTPYLSTWVAGLLVGIPAGIGDIGTFADLANIGTLFAFAVVSAGVLVLRKTDPDRPRGFRVPGAPWVPLLSIVSCLLLMLGLPLETWARFVVWLAIGLGIYFVFGRKHSALERGSQP